MNIQIPNLPARGARRAVRGYFSPRPAPRAPRRAAGFTMIEIALCLAIIGIGLVAIVGVLPIGMNTQRDTREATVIGQDATMLLEAIRNGSRGLDDLTNNIYLITNNWALYDNKGNLKDSGQNGYTFGGSTIPNNWPQGSSYFPITNGLRIIGLLTTPEYTDGVNPITNLFFGGYSNHIVAYVRSLSGLVAEKPPQDNPIMQEDAFSYRILSVNAPMAADPNALANSSYARQLAGNLREIRLLFLWPQLPNGNVGAYRQSFRAEIGGQIFGINDVGQRLYFYQSQSFTNAQ